MEGGAQCEVEELLVEGRLEAEAASAAEATLGVVVEDEAGSHHEVGEDHPVEEASHVVDD